MYYKCLSDALEINTEVINMLYLLSNIQGLNVPSIE